MAEENAFEKIHVDESEKADLGGVLEQLNLPPTAVQFVRKNQRTISLVLALITAVVVIWALYDSYLERKTRESSSALAVARKLSDDALIKSLEGVEKNFSGTDSALWASIEIARYHVDKKEFEKASAKYTEVRTNVKVTNPVYPLVTFGLAQAEEAQKNFSEALQEYSILKTTKGYESLGYSGAARIFEVQNDKEAAIKELEQYIGILMGESPTSPEKAFIDEKISRLKAAM